MKDLEKILSIIKLNPDTFYESEIAEAGKNIMEIIKKRNKENDFLIERISKKIIGCAGFERQNDTNGVYSLNWLAIHPDYKRRGIATGLYNFIEKHIEKLNARLIFLNAGSGEENRYFYSKMGFKASGRIPKYYNETKDLVLYYKFL